MKKITFPNLILENKNKFPNQVAVREKNLGIWQSWTWSQVFEEIKLLSCGLASLGVKRNMHLGIIGNNKPRLYWSFAASQSLGAVPVPLYQDSIAEELLYVLNDAEVNFIVVEDQEQVDKIMEFAEKTSIIKIIYDDPRGLNNYNSETLLSYDNLKNLGKKFNLKNEKFFFDEITEGDETDISVILYTSGTTSRPKGVCHTHKSLFDAAKVDVLFDKFNNNDSVLSYLPMAWVGDHIFSYAQAIITGFTINCPESPDTVTNDMREIGPTYYFAPPRVFENLLTQVMIKIDDAGIVKKYLFHTFMRVAKNCGERILNNQKVGIFEKILYLIGNILIYAPLKNVLGMSNVKVAYTGGAAIGPDLYSFYRSLGINLKQLYGQTETAASVCKQPNGDAHNDSVGKTLPGVTIKIDHSGEILVKAPGVFKEYHNNPKATLESFSKDGFFKTGDAGFFDENENLKIIDRAKDVGKLKDGSLFAPQFLENKLKFFSYIKEAVCFGDMQDKVCAFINIDLDALGNWAEKRGIAYAGYVDLASKDEVYDLVEKCINNVNLDLSKEDTLKNSQIRRFLILHKELDADDDELTRTRKVRRSFISEKYKILVDSLFRGETKSFISTKVKFEDGRDGQIEANIKIKDLKTS